MSALGTVAALTGCEPDPHRGDRRCWCLLARRRRPPGRRRLQHELFIAAGGNCVGAMFGGLIAARFGITAPFWAGFVVAVIVSASTWRVFNRAAVAQAYAEPD